MWLCQIWREVCFKILAHVLSDHVASVAVWGRVTLMWIVVLVDFDVLERYSDVGYMNSFLLKGHD